jgi:hypothetical protein
MKHGGSWNFAAAVTSASNIAVSWSIQEGSTGGAVSDAGVYTAPAANGIYHVSATSKVDATKSATAIVTVGNTGFTLTGSSTNVRFDHTATLLGNGQVFIAGGCSTNDWDYSLVDQAELFNPATGTFQSGDKLARCGHTATLLQNGDVLFAGGIVDAPDFTATAELLKAGNDRSSLREACALDATLTPPQYCKMAGYSSPVAMSALGPPLPKQPSSTIRRRAHLRRWVI